MAEEGMAEDLAAERGWHGYTTPATVSASGYAYAVSAYASVQATEKLSFHGRVEYFKDKQVVPGGNGVLFQDLAGGTMPAEVLSLTDTVQYDLWKNVISRVELRWDNSLEGNNLFGGTTPNAAGVVLPNAQNAWMLALNVIYKF
jgi:hypothetical protein